MVSTSKDPLTFNDLMATPIDFSNIELEYNFQECFNALTDKLDWNNPKGDRYPFDLSKPLPLQGPQVSKFSKQNVYSTKEILGVKSVSVKKLHRYGHLEEIIVKRSDPQLYKFKKVNLLTTPKRLFKDMLFSLLFNTSYPIPLDGVDIVDIIAALSVLDFLPGLQPRKPKRKWTAVDRKRLGLMFELIDKQLREREIIKNLERLVGARELELDYKLMTRTV
ncbi:hypothetical protein Tco_0846817 [Tanacetum coccineum]